MGLWWLILLDEGGNKRGAVKVGGLFQNDKEHIGLAVRRASVKKSLAPMSLAAYRSRERAAQGRILRYIVDLCRFFVGGQL